MCLTKRRNRNKKQSEYIRFANIISGMLPTPFYVYATSAHLDGVEFFSLYHPENIQFLCNQ